MVRQVTLCFGTERASRVVAREMSLSTMDVFLMKPKATCPFRFKAARLMIALKNVSSCWLRHTRRFAFKLHGAILTISHFMSVSLMYRHVNSQLCVCGESSVTDMTSLVFDVQVDGCFCALTRSTSSLYGICIQCGRMQKASRHCALVACGWRYFDATWFETCIPDSCRRTIRQSREILSNDVTHSSSTMTSTENQAEDI